MKTSLHYDIMIQAKRLLEQAPGGIPPLPPVGAPAPGAPPPVPAASENPEEESDKDMIAGGQPPVVTGGDDEQRIQAVFDYGMAIAKETIDPQVITNAFKSAIQANFPEENMKPDGAGEDTEGEKKGNAGDKSPPGVKLLKKLAEVGTLDDVADRLSNFMYGIPLANVINNEKQKGDDTVTESTHYIKRNNMQISKQEIRNMVREALGIKKTPIKEIHLSPKQLQTIVKKTIKKVMQESALFDTYRSQVGQVRSGIEQQLLSTEVQDMAIDLFEKICQKVGIDSDNLTPDAESYIRNELDEMVVSAQELGVKLMQVATIAKTAQTGTPEKHSNED